MPINNINKPALRAFAENLAETRATNPDAKIDGKQVDELLTIVGDRWFTDSADIKAKFESGNMTLDEKVALAKRGVSGGEKEDLVAFAQDPSIAAMITSEAASVLSALAGVSFADSTGAATGASDAGSAAAVGNMTFTPAQLEAVQKFKDIVGGGRLQQFYDAATGSVDNAQLKAEAMELFNALPPMGPTSNPQSFVDAGLWVQAPRGIEEMHQTARYLPGRQVLVKTTVNSEVFDGNDFLKFQEGGREGITYRATIAGEEGDNFLIQVDGRDEPIKVAKQEVFNLNQPHDVSSVKSGEHTYRFSYSTNANYDDPFTKAKVAEAALAVSEIVAKLDYTKMATDADDGLVGRISGSGREQMVALQREAVGEIHDVIDMKYPKGSSWKEPGRKRGSNLGRQAMKGAGVCFDQQGVMLGMLAPFQEALGVDIQAISGGVYRNIRDRGQNPFRGGAHGWLQLTYRPSMELRIVDRTWQQADHPADRAYSRWGDRYPAGFIRSLKQEPVSDTDVNCSGDISVETFDRQFGVQGSDGRDNHMSLNQ